MCICNSEYYFNSGTRYFIEKSFKKALECFNESIKIDPIAMNYYFQGLTFARLNNNIEAIKSFEKALNLENEAGQEMFSNLLHSRVIGNNVYKFDILYDFAIAYKEIDKCDKALELAKNVKDIFQTNWKSAKDKDWYKQSIENLDNLIRDCELLINQTH